MGLGMRLAKINIKEVALHAFCFSFFRLLYLIVCLQYTRLVVIQQS